MRFRRIWALGSLFLVIGCELIAGIDEKSAAPGSPPPGDGDASLSDSPSNDVDGSQTTNDSSAAADTGPPPECTKHTDCVAAHGESWICVKPDNVCRSLLSDDCDTLLAAQRGAPASVKKEVLEDDNTIFFGFIMDTRASGATAGVARRQAVELAVSDIHSITKGIPGGPGGKRRPIAVVACSETKDSASPADPKVPARHLIDDLHVPAIIGASNSDTTIDLFNGEAFPKGTLVFSPNSLSSALSSPSDNGLFWRTSATSVLQGRAIQDQIRFVEQDIRAQAIADDAGTGSDPLNLALVYIGDAFGKDIYPHITTNLRFNGSSLGSGANGPTCTQTPCSPSSHVFIKEYPSTVQLPELEALAAELNSFQPHIIVAVGRRDSVQISAALEALNPAVLPTHMYTQGSATADITTILTKAPNTNNVRARVRGTRPLASPDETNIFKPLYDTAFPSGPPIGNGVAGVFDITYLLTYAAFAISYNADPALPLTGARMNEGLKRVLSPAGDPIKVGTQELVKGLDQLQSGKFINMKGFSYIFDFDTAVGEAPGKVDVFCVTQGNDAGAAGNTLAKSGQVYDPQLDGGTTTGTFNCPLF